MGVFLMFAVIFAILFFFEDLINLNPEVAVWIVAPFGVSIFLFISFIRLLLQLRAMKREVERRTQEFGPVITKLRAEGEGIKTMLRLLAPEEPKPRLSIARTGKRAGLTVILTNVDPAKKIGVIKAVREIANLGLKEAKDLVESVPQPVMEGGSREEAEIIKKRLVEAGAAVEIK